MLFTISALWASCYSFMASSGDLFAALLYFRSQAVFPQNFFVCISSATFVLLVRPFSELSEKCNRFSLSLSVPIYLVTLLELMSKKFQAVLFIETSTEHRISLFISFFATLGPLSLEVYRLGTAKLSRFKMFFLYVVLEISFSLNFPIVS